MAEKRGRGGAAKRVGEFTVGAGDAAFRRFGFAQSTVIARWPEIVGDVFARHSSPEALRFPSGKRAGGTLHVRVTGAFAPALSMVEPEICERANRVFGFAAVARLHLAHGAPPETPLAEARPAEPPPVPRALEPSLKAIADPALRESLTSLARLIEVTRGSPVFD